MEDFPDVEQKLAAPKKLSAFEKERQAEKLKQQRAEEENAAALRAFEDSFADDGARDGGEEDAYSRDRGPPSGPRGYGFGGPRGRGGMPPMGPRSGPGSLGALPPTRSGPGSLGALPPTRSGPGSLPPMNAPPPPPRAKTPEMPFGAEKPREERPRFSMRNAPPPGQFAPPDSYDSPSRPSYNNRDAQPDAAATVQVRPPANLAEIRAIHITVDYMLRQKNPRKALEFEAGMLRSQKIRRDPNMQFLFDSRSPGGIYYRWLLWTPHDKDDAAREARRRAREPERIFADVPIDWMPPQPQLPFPDLKSLADAVTDIDYESSDEESDEDEGGEARQFNRGPQGESNGLESDEKDYLGPLKRARLVFLLSRLPTSIARLPKGDVARVTNFAIKNAGSGAEEVVDLLLLNAAKPFCYSLAAKYEIDSEQDSDDEYEPEEDLGNLGSPAPGEATTNNSSGKHKDDDGSNAKLIGIYLISDILSASSTAGVRNAWRYRQLFEQGFREVRTFERLGRVEKELAWGRIKAEQWKRKVEVVLGTWEGWAVFGSEVLEELRGQFFGEKGLQGEGEKVEDGGESEAVEEREGDGKEAGNEVREDIDGVPMSDSE